MILAGIDIGTNTLRLLVAKTGPDSFHEIYADRKVTRLGQDLDRKGMLGREARDRSLKVLGDFIEKCQHHAALHIAAIGTSALRTASNAETFIDDVKRETGLAISVITGKEEARLTRIGVVRALRRCTAGNIDPLKSALIIDIGGGSTEMIMNRIGEEPALASLPLGAVYLTDRFVKHDPPKLTEIEQIRNAVKDVLEQHSGTMGPGTSDTIVGTAGTITTLAAMDLSLSEYDPDKVTGHTLTRRTVDAIVRKLTESTLEERRAIPGLEKGREDIILAGAVVTQTIMERFGYPTMVVSDRGLREGIVLDLADKHCNDTNNTVN